MVGRRTSELTNRQIVDLLWQVKGTSEAQPLYAELAARPQGETLSLDDPDWQAKLSTLLMGQSLDKPSKLPELG